MRLHGLGMITGSFISRSNLYLEVHLRSDSVLGDLKPIMQASKDKSNRSDQLVERIRLEG